MKVIKTIAILFVLSLVVAWLGVQFLTIRIPVGQVGVRVQQYGLLGDQGVVMEDFGPGWHRDLGPIDSWELFDSTVQALEMTRDPRYGSTHGVDDVKVQTLDGYKEEWNFKSWGEKRFRLLPRLGEGGLLAELISDSNG